MHVHPATNEKRLAISAWIVFPATVLSSLLAYTPIIAAKLAFSRLVLIVIAIELVCFAALQGRRALHLLVAFFTSATHPLNLALFRIVVFYWIFEEVRLATIVAFSRIPAGLRVAPWGMATILGHLPINPQWAAIAGVLVLIFSVTGLIGCFSRTSAALCFVFGFYALGIPQFYGKIDHYNHLIWFAALLAVSPCGDFLAIDAVFAARSRAEHGVTLPPEASQIYALPLRLAMILVGIIYFFPGFWKIWESGFGWATAGNLQKQLYLFWTWSLRSSWLPSFRIDQHPALCRLGAIGTVSFELSFIFLLFFPELRKLAAVEGVAFHKLTEKFMRISFSSLQWSYVAFFDWIPILRTIGSRLYPEEMFFFFDGNCAVCRRKVAALRVLDVFGRIAYSDLQRLDPTSESIPAGIQTRTHLFAVIGNRQFFDYAAYRAVAGRIPCLWPVIPLLYLPRPAGRLNIHQPTVEAQADASSVLMQASKPRRVQLLAITSVGATLVFACVFCGANKIVSGWPFACYPTFSVPAADKVETVQLIALGPSGETVPIEIPAITYDRLYWVFGNILAIKDPLLQQARLRELWLFATESDPALKSVSSVKFFRKTSWTAPELWKSNLGDQHLLLELKLAACGAPSLSGAASSCSKSSAALTLSSAKQ